MKLMIRIFTMKLPWNLWVMVLAAVNLAGGVLFWTTLEGKMALASMMGGMMVMQMIYAKFGFVRLLGLGHILFWFPFLGWSLWRLLSWNELLFEFRTWLLFVSIVNSLSLILDTMDVWRFAQGDREEL